MKIGILGAGNIGSLLARKLAASGREIKLANSKGPETIADLARNVGARAVTKEEAVVGVDVIILSIPFANNSGLKDLLARVPGDVVVVDTSNYYPMRDGEIPGLDDGKAEGLWVSEQIGRPTVKAWNAVVAHTLDVGGAPKGTRERIALPFAGDNAARRALVAELIDETGFDPVDTGSLEESWRQQPGTPAYCTELTRDELVAALAKADRQAAPRNRDALINEFIAMGEGLTHEVAIRRNREVTAVS